MLSEETLPKKPCPLGCLLSSQKRKTSETYPMDGHDLSSSEQSITISPATDEIETIAGGKQAQPHPESESQPDPESESQPNPEAEMRAREMKLVRCSFDGIDDISPSFADTYTRKKRIAWPNGASQTKWIVMDRRLGLSLDPEAAAEKLWRKHEKRLKQAQSKSENKDDLTNPAEN